MKRILIMIIALLSLNSGFAQDFFNALRYSQTQYGGTARSIAMGSAFGALGGDFSSTSINPAGLGFYRSSEFTISPTLNFNQIDATYLKNTEPEDKYNFNFNNLSYVATANTNANNGIISISFGVGYNRLKNFSSNSHTQGYGAKTTLLNYFADYANSPDITGPSQFDPHYEGLAWNTWLLDEDPDLAVVEGIYYNDLSNYQDYDVVDNNGNFLGIGYRVTDVKPHQQRRVAGQSGRIDEYLMSLGMNINHKVYIGASMSFVDLEYKSNVLYSEIDNENQSDYLNNYSLRTETHESGFGVNFKTGIIYRPFKSLRIGAAFHTPTFYEISFYEDKKVVATFDQSVGNDDTGYSSTWEDKNTLRYNYNLETPINANFSLAYTFSDKALLSFDYELIGYQRTKFREAGDGYDYSTKNSELNKVFNTSGNIRVGAEYRLSPNVSLRGGFNYFGNPWNESITFTDGTSAKQANFDDTFLAYTGGIGYRQNHFFIDFAYRLNQLNYAVKVHEMYYTNPNNADALANFSELNHQATITLGFRF